MKRALLAGAALLLLGLVAAGIYGGLRYRQGQDVRGSSTEEFTPTEVAPPAPPEPGVFWPAYGFDPERHHVANYPHRPPYKVRWFFRARTLVEFPPAIGYGRLYFTNNYGRLYAVNAKTGKRAWKKDSGRCVASSPAVWEHLVIQTYLAKHPCNRGKQKGLTGLVVARFAGFGQFRWQARIAPSESSPVVVDRVVYVGDWSGRVYALYAAHREAQVVLQDEGQDQGRRRGLGQPRLRRLVRPPPLRARTARRASCSGARRRSSGSASAASSTRRPQPRTAASTSAARTARSTRSARRPASCAGRTRRAATCTRRRRSGASSS